MFTEKEKKYLNDTLRLNIKFNELTDDDYIRIEEAVGDRLTLHCLDDEYNPNDEGLLCEDILDKLS